MTPHRDTAGLGTHRLGGTSCGPEDTCLRTSKSSLQEESSAEEDLGDVGPAGQRRLGPLQRKDPFVVTCA